MRSLQGDIV